MNKRQLKKEIRKRNYWMGLPSQPWDTPVYITVKYRTPLDGGFVYICGNGCKFKWPSVPNKVKRHVHRTS